MSHLPLIVGFGGINPAGRSSFHHAYRRLIFEKLDHQDQQNTLLGLATLTGLATYKDGHYFNKEGDKLSLENLLTGIKDQLLSSTLIRRIEADCFDVNQVTFNKAATLKSTEKEPIRFTLRKRHLPNIIPDNWSVTPGSGQEVEITIIGNFTTIIPDFKTAQVQSAGQLPSGFSPGKLYPSRSHPRNLQMTVYSASDALLSTGIPFDDILNRISPDQVAVYASNSIGQLDDFGFGGLTKYPSIGKRTSSKQMPLGYAQMPADFVNAYILGNVGATGGALGACATFLYNLRSGVQDIRSGRRKVVLVGGSDAPVTPEVIEGFRAMGALAEDKDLQALDKLTELTDADYRKACRPFGNNCGFTISEASQFIVLMSDDLAMELGAEVYGAVPDVFVNADGHKKSIAAPGIGNYITLGKAASLIKSMLGEESLKQRSYVQAHGTSTPQNRVTESHVINEIAKAFDIKSWPVAAIKCYIGHSQGTAGGDQLIASLGTWAYGYIPGIQTTDEIASDVHQSNLLFSQQHLDVGVEGMDSVILNSKGFGGNNASAPMLAPHIVRKMLLTKHGQQKMTEWEEKKVVPLARALEYDQQTTLGLTKPIYHYDHNVLVGYDLEITENSIRLPGYENKIDLTSGNPFSDYTAK
ncbi:beta-ketoacyl synthase [Neptunomonas antarctica]|uniref:Acetoacetyl-[acyl-carrier protein] synthase n=1 Tax=Neptunomonas antarctica TaxID=619304 RepID=A0A1N7J8R4_9GAMM|nr:beta-ketoacyl synthase [Neptunomonas antarctica]SIS45743.1 acetoacetyl-[acyl-carrier protein] synthase [Neptunomonas antarctica]